MRPAPRRTPSTMAPGRMLVFHLRLTGLYFFLCPLVGRGALALAQERSPRGERPRWHGARRVQSCGMLSGDGRGLVRARMIREGIRREGGGNDMCVSDEYDDCDLDVSDDF